MNNNTTNKAVKEFKRIFERIFNERLTDEEACEKARRLLELYKTIYLHTKLKESKNYEQRRKDN